MKYEDGKILRYTDFYMSENDLTEKPDSTYTL